MGKFQDLTGQTFGNLKVIGKTTDPIKSKKGKYIGIVNVNVEKLRKFTQEI